MSQEPSKDPEAEEKEEQEIVKLPRKEYEELLVSLKNFEGMKDKFLRGAADYENTKKRTHEFQFECALN